MPKDGYGAITIPTLLKEQLTLAAKASAISVPRFIEDLLVWYSTYSTNDQNGLNEEDFKNGCFSQTEFEFGSPGEIRTLVSGSRARHA